MEEMKIKVLENMKGLDKGVILNVINPDLSTDNTYNYAKDNQVNAMDEFFHICIGGVKALGDIDGSDENDWLFDEYEIIEIDGNNKMKYHAANKDLTFIFEYIEYNSFWKVTESHGQIFIGYKSYIEAKNAIEKRYGVIISDDRQ